MAIIVENVKETFSNPTTRFIKCLVAGPPGSGKTLTASTWPNVLYADAEGRLLSIRDRDVRRVEILSLADLDELKAALDQKPDVRAQMLGGPVDTVVVDTVDEIARIVIKERLRAERKETMAIADWGYLGDTLRALLRGYRNLDCNLVLNVHLKSEEDSESERVRYKAAIQGAVGDQIAEFVDECFLLVARPVIDPISNERVINRHLQTYPDPQHDWVKDHSGSLPQEFPINFKDDYDRLSALIFGQPASGNGTASKASARERPSQRGRQPLAATVDVPLPAKDVAPVEAPPTPRRVPKTKPEEPPPEDEPEPLPEPSADEPSDTGQIQVVPEVGTEPGPGDPLDDLGTTFPCDACGKPVEDRNYQDLSMIRYGVPLCRAHFIAKNKH